MEEHDETFEQQPLGTEPNPPSEDLIAQDEKQPNAQPQVTRQENTCVRIGIPSRTAYGQHTLTRQQLHDLVDQTHMHSKVEYIAVEPEVDRHYYMWGRIYFLSSEAADEFAALLLQPGRVTEWRVFATQRLPLPDPYDLACDDTQSGDPCFQPFIMEIPDMIVVDTQEGFIAFNTHELYQTKGLADAMQAKAMGKSIRRLICKHFDPNRKQICRYGAACMFIHAKVPFMSRLLRSSATHTTPLRPNLDEDALQVCLWEHDRREDTLVIRSLDPDAGKEGLNYMFGTCTGFQAAYLRENAEGRPYGIVKFRDKHSAMYALQQTYGADLNISFFGVMEDLRAMMVRSREAPPGSAVPTPTSLEAQSGRDWDQHPKRERDEHLAATPAASPSASALEGSGGRGAPSEIAEKPVPFPELPEGWVHGVSRRTGQYYFYKKHAKNQTTWKHPLTGEGYQVPS